MIADGIDQIPVRNMEIFFHGGSSDFAVRQVPVSLILLRKAVEIDQVIQVALLEHIMVQRSCLRLFRVCAVLLCQADSSVYNSAYMAAAFLR